MVEGGLDCEGLRFHDNDLRTLGIIKATVLGIKIDLKSIDFR